MVYFILGLIYLIPVIISYIGLKKDYKGGLDLGFMGVLFIVPIVNIFIACMFIIEYFNDKYNYSFNFDLSWESLNRFLFGKMEK